MLKLAFNFYEMDPWGQNFQTSTAIKNESRLIFYQFRKNIFCSMLSNLYPCSFVAIRSRFRPPLLCNIFSHPVEHCQKKLSVLLFSLFPQLFENVHRLRRSWVRILGLSISLCRLNTETKHCVLVPRPNSMVNVCEC